MRPRDAYFRGKTLDDVLRYALESILKHGDPVTASKGSTTEVRGILLELTNPRARLSRTESRGKPFSCVGELCWYLAKTNRTDFVAHYIREYRKFDEKGRIFGGYGPRLFKRWKGVRQFDNVIKNLQKKPTTRQAILQLFDSKDLAKPHKDVPCTCTLQFILRKDKLHLIAYMRSNDVIKGLPHDVFCFTMLQEIAARILKVELGTYKHCVGSLHLYDNDQEKAKDFLGEGWQSTKSIMPPMPLGDPRASISSLLKAEAAIRTGMDIDHKKLGEMNPYWADIVRLLQIFSYRKSKQTLIHETRQRMVSPIYDTYIERTLDNGGKSLK